jgi:hypothetical protein
MSFTGLPTELLQMVYSHTTIHSALALSQTSKTNYLAFTARRLQILQKAVQNTYDPLPELLQLVMCNYNVWLDFPNVLDRQRRIVTFITAPFTYHPPAFELIKQMVWYGNIANRWVEYYPQMRWRFQSGNRRELCVHEAERLRRAIYISWIYQSIFHKTPECEDIAFRFNFPRPFIIGDPRTEFLQHWGEEDLSQVSEWLYHLRKFLQMEIFPWDEVMAGYIDHAERQYVWDGFTRVKNGHQYAYLLDRVMKLDPREILEFFEDEEYVTRQQLQRLEDKGEDFGEVGDSLNLSLLAVGFEKLVSGVDPFYPSLHKERGMLSTDIEEWSGGRQCPIVGGKGNGPDLRCSC